MNCYFQQTKEGERKHLLLEEGSEEIIILLWKVGWDFEANVVVDGGWGLEDISGGDGRRSRRGLGGLLLVVQGVWGGDVHSTAEVDSGDEDDGDAEADFIWHLAELTEGVLQGGSLVAGEIAQKHNYRDGKADTEDGELQEELLVLVLSLQLQLLTELNCTL